MTINTINLLDQSIYELEASQINLYQTSQSSIQSLGQKAIEFRNEAKRLGQENESLTKKVVELEASNQEKEVEIQDLIKKNKILMICSVAFAAVAGVLYVTKR
jgi:chromosome segregation ATPase